MHTAVFLLTHGQVGGTHVYDKNTERKEGITILSVRIQSTGARNKGRNIYGTSPILLCTCIIIARNDQSRIPFRAASTPFVSRLRHDVGCPSLLNEIVRTFGII